MLKKINKKSTSAKSMTRGTTPSTWKLRFGFTFCKKTRQRTVTKKTTSLRQQPIRWWRTQQPTTPLTSQQLDNSKRRTTDTYPTNNRMPSIPFNLTRALLWWTSLLKQPEQPAERSNCNGGQPFNEQQWSHSNCHQRFNNQLHSIRIKLKPFQRSSEVQRWPEQMFILLQPFQLHDWTQISMMDRKSPICRDLRLENIKQQWRICLQRTP